MNIVGLQAHVITMCLYLPLLSSSLYKQQPGRDSLMICLFYIKLQLLQIYYSREVFKFLFDGGGATV